MLKQGERAASVAFSEAGVLPNAHNRRAGAKNPESVSFGCFGVALACDALTAVARIFVSEFTALKSGEWNVFAPNLSTTGVGHDVRTGAGRVCTLVPSARSTAGLRITRSPLFTPLLTRT
jgi:hypothetical protein